MSDFQQRMYQASEDVYAAIQRGELVGADQVEAALLDAHLKASSDDE